MSQWYPGKNIREALGAQVLPQERKFIPKEGLLARIARDREEEMRVIEEYATLALLLREYELNEQAEFILDIRADELKHLGMLDELKRQIEAMPRWR